MRRYVYLAITVFVASVMAVLPAGPASAAGNVLTFGSAGGTAVPVNDVLTAGLSSPSATFFSAANGNSGITCTTSSFSATVTGNPAAPGTATESLTAQSFSNCTTNVSGATGVRSITINNLPYNASVSDAAGGPVTISGTSSSSRLQATAVINTIIGSITCVFQASSIAGSASNTGNTLQFSNQQFTKSSGPGQCPSSSFFSATYGPVVDSSQAGSPAVFVN
jgi:hypothetical protein